MRGSLFLLADDGQSTTVVYERGTNEESSQLSVLVCGLVFVLVSDGRVECVHGWNAARLVQKHAPGDRCDCCLIPGLNYYMSIPTCH